MSKKKQTVLRNFDYEEINAQDAFEEFIIEKEAINLTKKTIDGYKWAWGAFKKDFDINEYFLIEDIDIQIVYKWIALLKQRVKTVSVNSYITYLRSFLYWCMEDERRYIKKPYKIHLLKKQEIAPKHYTEEEVAALLVKPKINSCFGDWRSWAIISFILGTGARASTISNMTIGNIDFTNKEINLGHTKNKRALIIPLSPTLEVTLKDYIRLWRNKATAEDLLFPNVSNEILPPVEIWRSVGRFLKKRGVEKTSIHGLRHTFAIGWVRNNGNMFALQKILGHSSLEMTRRYVRLFAEDIKVDFELYNPLDRVKPAKSGKYEIKRIS